MSREQKYVVVREQEGLTDKPIWLVPVVNPEGAIKFVRANQFIQSALVTLTPANRDRRTKQAPGELPTMDVQLKPGLAEEGWAFLADLFHEDRKDAAWPVYQEWLLNGPMGRVGGDPRPFPPKYLPAGVAKRKARRAEHQAPAADIQIPELDGGAEARQ
ncbi:hypothetical protein OV203_02480 [Nannocystis sp. ILAH1]|uniref:hypothetical protein n=1 Tax=Nannocystis sp. ILAH1 TaxID=2996789 RepID=UPI00226D9BA4|nr:hypothetical protein [Nannocystis sp. ILAH1]MCY0985978.1 hypothetical protein [Nannocystis sp. ILAH1]